jgi:hypothetical protein
MAPPLGGLPGFAGLGYLGNLPGFAGLGYFAPKPVVCNF